MEPWYKVVEPRREIKEGRSFNPDEFAIHLEQVVAKTAPEDYRKYLRTLRQGPVPVSGVFPAGSDSCLLETGLQAIRLSPYRADPPARRPERLGTAAGFLACYFPRLTFRCTGQPSDPKTPPPVHAR